MRRGAAHVKVLNRRTILRPARCGTQKEELLERQFALKNISLRQPKFAFEIERRQDLPMQNDVFDVRRMFSNCVDDGVAKSFAFIVPIPLQVVRRILHEARHYVLARRGY